MATRQGLRPAMKADAQAFYLCPPNPKHDNTKTDTPDGTKNKR